MIVYLKDFQALISMNQIVQTFSAHALRTLMLSETKKIARELECGTPLTELEAIQAHMKDIADVLAVKTGRIFAADEEGINSKEVSRPEMRDGT